MLKDIISPVYFCDNCGSEFKVYGIKEVKRCPDCGAGKDCLHLNKEEERKYVIKIEREDKFLMKGWTQKEAYCPLFEDALLMTLSEAKEILDAEEVVYEVIYDKNGKIELVEVGIK